MANTMTNFQQVTTIISPAAGATPSGFTFQGARSIWLLLGLLESLFALRIVLQLIGASLANPLVALLYNFTSVFLLPFGGLTTGPAASGTALEISMAFAIVAYALVGWVFERMAWAIFFRPYVAVAITTAPVFDQRPL